MPFWPLLGPLTVAGTAGPAVQARCEDRGYKDTLKIPQQDQPGPRVAVIGAGVGGTSCAFFLREKFRDAITIDVYEKDKVGGRTSVVPINNELYESGASIIHGKNRYLVDFAKQFGLEKRQSGSRVFGMSDGKKIYFTGSTDMFTMGLKMLWRYGMDFPRSLYFVSLMLEKFGRIYQLQDQGHAFSNVQDLLHACSVDFVRLSQMTLRGTLGECGFKDKFIEEIAMAAVHNNYGQSVNKIQGFAGFVALAGIASDLWSVKGGNYLIPQNLLKQSKANLIQADVKEVKLLPNGQYELSYEKMKPKYDIVVIANPQTIRNEIKLTGFGRPLNLKSPYERIVTHLVRGIVNPDFFTEHSDPFPTEITVTNPANYFNTLAVNNSVQGSKAEINPKDVNVWKMFAKRLITQDELNHIFSKIDSKTTVDWLAYPHFSPGGALPSFVVHRNLYYLNAIERAASAMEMAAIAGRNISLLIYNDWKERPSKIDNEFEISRGDKGRLLSHSPQ